MELENETIEKMLEREKRRRISEKYKSPKNDRYRQTRTRRTRNFEKNQQNEIKKSNYSINAKEKNIKIPARFLASTAIFAALAIYFGFGGENAQKAEEKLKSILNENVSFEDIAKTGDFIKNIGNSENIKIDNETLEKMEEDTYIEDYP